MSFTIVFSLIRGQESCGTVASNGQEMFSKEGMGLVGNDFRLEILQLN